jgi:hypothetical protein
MERVKWTDERMDDTTARIDATLIRLETKMDAGFARVDDRFTELRRDMLTAVLSVCGVLGAALVAVLAATL